MEVKRKAEKEVRHKVAEQEQLRITQETYIHKEDGGGGTEMQGGQRGGQKVGMWQSSQSCHTLTKAGRVSESRVERWRGEAEATSPGSVCQVHQEDAPV